MKILDRRLNVIELLMKMLDKKNIIKLLDKQINTLKVKKEDSRMNQKELIMKIKDSSGKNIEKMLKI